MSFMEKLAEHLSNADACAQNRDIDGAISYARLALEIWEEAGYPENASEPPYGGVEMTRRERRRLNRFHRRCDRLGVPGDVRHRLIRMAEATGEKLKAPDWYAGRASTEGRWAS